MILDTYRDDITAANALANQRKFLSNFSYKIDNDENVKKMLEVLPSYAIGFDSLTHLELFYLKTHVSSHLKIFTALLNATMSYTPIANASPEEITKPRKFFADNIGERIIRLIGTIPLLILVQTKIDYDELQRNSTSVEDAKDYQNDKRRGLLDPEHAIYKTFVKDDVFIDEVLKQEKRTLELTHYSNSEKVSIDLQIQALHETISNHPSHKKGYLEIGTQYWIERVKTAKTVNDGMAALLKGMLVGAEARKKFDDKVKDNQ